MLFGKDFFKTLDLVVRIMRLMAEVLGEDEDTKAKAESEAEPKKSHPSEAE